MTKLKSHLRCQFSFTTPVACTTFLSADNIYNEGRTGKNNNCQPVYDISNIPVIDAGDVHCPAALNIELLLGSLG